ncbi:MAG TPA: Bax inhibitor-1/YccA family protein [Candidatus Stackebrandtia faecavium]|nr:Bax inhibitor-1/YccA family protein [Candidatus Stackebrandtia faecavium]
MRSNNPALNRMLNSTAQQRQMAPEYGHYGDMSAPPRVEPMTLDDVVVRTIGMLLLTGIAGAFSWSQVDTNPQLAMGLMMVGGIVSLGVILVSWFTNIANPWVVGIYAAAQGLALGVVSAMYESMWNGIVLQAVVATFGVFFGMALLYKAKIVRNSPKFTKFMIGTGFGIMALILVNFVMSMVGINMGLFNNDPNSEVSALQWIIALVMVGWGALSFILDFDMVEQGVRYGAPKKFAWAATFGLVAGLIFLYWSILRLLGYINR